MASRKVKKAEETYTGPALKRYKVTFETWSFTSTTDHNGVRNVTDREFEADGYDVDSNGYLTLYVGSGYTERKLCTFTSWNSIEEITNA